MTPAETARVLAAAAAFDQRTVGKSDVAAWHAALGEVEFSDARDAVVRHYRATAERIMPVHVLHHAGEIRLEREAREWQDANAHWFVGAGPTCEECKLPFANRRHRKLESEAS